MFGQTLNWKRVIIGAVIIWACSGIAIYFIEDTWEKRGQFGDMFGAVNALFSALALVGVIAAIVMQKEELALLHEELASTRKELKLTAEAQCSSAASLASLIQMQAKGTMLSAMSAIMDSYRVTIEAALAGTSTRNDLVTTHDEWRAKIESLLREIEAGFASMRRDLGAEGLTLDGLEDMVRRNTEAAEVKIREVSQNAL